jgi:hypothetical protein
MVNGVGIFERAEGGKSALVHQRLFALVDGETVAAAGAAEPAVGGGLVASGVVFNSHRGLSPDVVVVW